MRRKGIAAHEPPDHKGDSVIWLTPPNILSQLGMFTLDPCAAPSPRPWPTALRHIELPEDGLTATWSGRVWLNPPYDETTHQWMQRMAHHQNGTALTFARTETELWQKWIFPFCKALLFISGRLWFRYPNGTKGPYSAGAPSVLIAYSDFDVKILKTCGIAGGFCIPEKRHQ